MHTHSSVCCSHRHLIIVLRGEWNCAEQTMRICTQTQSYEWEEIENGMLKWLANREHAHKQTIQCSEAKFREHYKGFHSSKTRNWLMCVGVFFLSSALLIILLSWRSAGIHRFYSFFFFLSLEMKLENSLMCNFLCGNEKKSWFWRIFHVNGWCIVVYLVDRFKNWLIQWNFFLGVSY